jgi:hypothetical protein
LANKFKESLAQLTGTFLPSHNRGNSVDIDPACPMAPTIWENLKPAVATLLAILRL